MKSKRNISNFFLQKNFQGKVIVATLFTGMVGFGSILILLLFFSASPMSYDITSSHLVSTPLPLLKTFLSTNWFLLLMIGVIMIIFTLIGTHRIAGPLYRFEIALEKISQGDLTDTIVLRKNDEGKMLAQRINALNESLSHDLNIIRRNATFIEDVVTIQFETTGASKRPEDFKAICYAIQQKNSKILETLESYSLKQQ